jgi:hypothetical protein
MRMLPPLIPKVERDVRPMSTFLLAQKIGEAVKLCIFCAKCPDREQN